jgi:hypothetical protein
LFEKKRSPPSVRAPSTESDKSEVSNRTDHKKKFKRKKSRKAIIKMKNHPTEPERIID